MRIKDALKWGNEQLILTSESARLDAELLLSYVLKREVTFLLAHDEQKVSFWTLRRYKTLIEKRKKGMPVAYLTGHKEFFFLDLIVNRHVLIPRPDTEILVECVLNYLKGIGSQESGVRNQQVSDPQVVLLDIGTGSGCIPIAVCKNAEGLKAVATDISRKALKVAAGNIRKYRLKSRIKLIRSDLLEQVPAGLFKGKEVIVTANLPYIPVDYQVSPELKYEPSISLFGGEDGLSLYKKITQELDLIKPKAIFFELFEDQIAILKAQMPDYRLKWVKNMSGKARVMMMERVN